MNDSGASAALDIVKDGAKLKAKLKELADAEANLTDSHDKVKKRNKKLNVEFDEMTTLMAETIEKAKAKASGIREDANSAMRPVEKAKRELAQREKAFGKKVEKFEFDQKQMALQKSQLADMEASFLERVEAFDDTVATLMQGAK
tara:strand:- start:956 stop:1390 length:435 start_codon:yes stop_codon:yes gene_type:complete